MNVLKRSVALITAVLILVSASSFTGTGAYAATSTAKSSTTEQTAAENTAAVPAATTVSGYKTLINKRLNQAVTIKADIYPADEERTVKLQRYNTSKAKWSTITTITAVSTTGDGHASVSFDVPAEKRNKTTSKGRIYVSKTEKAAAGKSKAIRIITRNLSKISLSAKAAVVYRVDGTGKGTLIYTKNSTTERAQASTTKLMTAILAIDSGKLGKTTKISKHAAATPWGSGMLKAGDKYYNKDLMYAMLMPSSNDAATAVSEMVSGTEAKFVKKMNARAAAMGLTHTHFCNPHGLDADGHYTTATELAQLTAAAYTYPLISEIWNTKVKTIKSITYKRSWTLWSTNAIFGYDSNFKGGKTGTEDNAGCCFAGAYELNGVTYITVVLGSGYGFSRWLDTKKLHSYIKSYAESSY